jgi:hypothetical protein
MDVGSSGFLPVDGMALLVLQLVGGEIDGIVLGHDFY